MATMKYFVILWEKFGLEEYRIVAGPYKTAPQARERIAQGEAKFPENVGNYMVVRNI